MKRTQVGLTGAELAQRADISPSYVSLIEKGAKVPDEDVAARLARVLNDDQDLYRAWARASRLGLHRITLLNRIEAISRSPEYLNLVERGDALPDAPPADVRQGRARASDPTRLASPVEPEILHIPVLADGVDPGRALPSPLAIRDRLVVDRRLVADHSPERLFAYEVTLPAMKHLRGLASPGDRIVFQRGGRVGPDRICAVRTTAGIVLSRVLFKGRSLLLLPGEGERDFASVDVDGAKALPGAIAGTHVLLIRR